LKLKDKVAVVNSAAAGIGKEIAKKYAEEGAKVLVAGFNEAGIEAVAKEITDKGGTAKALKVNTAKREDIDQMIDTVVKEYGTLDILVNNPGMMDGFEPVADLTEEQWDKLFEVNTKSVMRSMRKALPVFRQKGRGTIINTASTAGLNGAHAGAAYTASMHAVIGLTKNTAYMYANEGVRCNAIAPGGVAINMGAQSQQISQFGLERMRPAHAVMSRVGTDTEVAQAALFLASNDASLVNGAVITADAGWTAAF
jgi:NAD(P)-dependent dehydrogenase (short-subunit alcohol dehydrogenase family)